MNKKQLSFLLSMLIITVLMTTPILIVGAAPLDHELNVNDFSQELNNQFIDSDGDGPGGSSDGTFTLLEPTSHSNDNNGVNNGIGDSVDNDFDSMTNQIIIQFAESRFNNSIDPSSVAQISRINTAAGITLTYVREMSGELHVLRLPSRMPKTALEKVIEKIAALPEVVFAEPDAIRRHTAVSNDPLYSQQWHYFAPTSGNYGINLPPAWDLAHSLPSVVVAVVDTGITSHVEFVGQTVPGYDFIHDPLVANDGDGRDNDPSDPGDWVTSAESSSGYFQGCQVSDSSWHGTHVAGTIGARTNNNIGVAGINWNVKILPIRVLGKCTGYTSDLVDGMRWAAGLSVPGVPANPNPAKVLNLSLGGKGLCSSTEQNAINAINATGATIVVAAGNSNANAIGYAPGNCDGVITVAATNRNGSRSSYSNYGSIIDISAPGGDSLGRVYSTIDLGKRGPTGDTYGFMQGTSMAAPHVSGVVSLLYAANNSLTWNQVKQILQGNVTPFPAGSTCNVSICGSGILNAYLALQTLGQFEPPPTPTGVSASDGAFTDKVQVSWSPSAGATSYQVFRHTSNNSSSAISLTSSHPASPYNDTSAVPGTTYYYWVKACNSAGCSGFSTSDSGYRAIEIKPPSPPTGVSASDGTFTDKVRVTWGALFNPDLQVFLPLILSGGGSSSPLPEAPYFQVFRNTTNSSAGAIKLVDHHTSNPYDDASAVPGTTYYYWVKACNSAGCSGFSTSDSGYRGVEITTPSPPTGVSASDGAYTDKVQVSWTASVGATTYQVFRHTSNNSSSATSLADSTSSPYNDTSAVAGTTYYYWIKACNSAGCSGFSTSDSGYRGVEVTEPNPPTDVTASDGTYTDKVRVSWSLSDGATYYEVYRHIIDDADNASPLTKDHPASPYDDTSAVPVTTYYYWVKACNSAGCSGFSAYDMGTRASEVTAPAPPTDVSASDGTYTDKVQVAWTASAGATYYQVFKHTSNSSSSASLLAETTSNLYNDTSAVAGTTYYYWVKACNSADCSGFSASDTGWCSTTSGIANGDFEADPDESWTEYSEQGWDLILHATNLPEGVTPHGGDWAAWLGGDDDEIARLSQSVTISASQPYLHFWYWISSSDACGYDYARVKINTTTIETYDLCASASTGAWVPAVLNLSAYAGSTVTLQFEVTTDDSLLSSFYLDDVSLSASATAAPYDPAQGGTLINVTRDKRQYTGVK